MFASEMDAEHCCPVSSGGLIILGSLYLLWAKTRELLELLVLKELWRSAKTND